MWEPSIRSHNAEARCAHSCIFRNVDGYGNTRVDNGVSTLVELTAFKHEFVACTVEVVVDIPVDVTLNEAIFDVVAQISTLVEERDCLTLRNLEHVVFFKHIVSVSWVVLGAYRRIAGVVEVLVGTGGGDAFKVASFESSLIVFRACVDVSWVVNVG